MSNNSELNTRVSANFMKVKFSWLIPPFILLSLCFLYFLFNKGNDNNLNEYVNIQKDLFLYLNDLLSQLPNLQFNLTQLGDVLIFFPLVSIFIIYAPKVWEGLTSSIILSLFASAGLKKLFAVPRPAAMIDTESFTIIGRTLTGSTSLPSGHSIATFVVISVLLFAFMPDKTKNKIIWTISMLAIGLIIAFSRVGVGAHYPLDVITGSTIGYIVSVLGIAINNRKEWMTCLKNKKYYPIYMSLLAVWFFLIIPKIIKNNLPVFYLAMLSLLVSIYIMFKSYRNFRKS